MNPFVMLEDRTRPTNHLQPADKDVDMYGNEKVPEIVSGTISRLYSKCIFIYVDPKVNSQPVNHRERKEAISSSCVGAQVRNTGSKPAFI